MQHIPITEEQFKKLTGVAHAAGFEDIPAFINALANEEVVDPRGPITAEERRASVAMIKRGNAEIEAGGVLRPKQLSAPSPRSTD